MTYTFKMLSLKVATFHAKSSALYAKRFPDFLKVAISIAVTAVTRLKDVIIATTYYLMICAVFVICVLWNGGVVLGEYASVTRLSC